MFVFGWGGYFIIYFVKYILLRYYELIVFMLSTCLFHPTSVLSLSFVL